jgi:hypothetical protein
MGLVDACVHEPTDVVLSPSRWAVAKPSPRGDLILSS